MKIYAWSLLLLLTLCLSSTFADDTTGERRDADTARQSNDAVTDLTSDRSAQTGEEINWQVVSSGGTEGGSTSYRLSGTVAQTAVGAGAAVSNAVLHGYWQDFDAGSGCCGEYTGGATGNTNCDDQGKYNLSDITTLISRVYIDPGTPLCCEENGDINCDSKMNLSDITTLICYVYVDPENCEPCLCEELP